MSRIILQPTANKMALEHYRNTILKPVSVSIIEKHVSLGIAELIKSQYPNGEVYVWGVKNGKNNTTKNKWEKIQRGDVTLFSKKGGIFASAVTTMTFQSESLAKELWGEDENNNTWENIYLVDEIKNINIPYEILNPALGYNKKYVIQGFNVLNDELSEKLNSRFELLSESICEDISEKEYTDTIIKLGENSNLDFEAKSIRRVEQSFLRKHLFKGKSEGVCGICGRILPVNLLITSHIKKRSECNTEEKLDYKNIVMPMCKLGCDDLYEKGYVYVENGTIYINNKMKISEDLRTELNKLDGKKCDYYNGDSKKYFDAHKKKYM